MFGAAYFAAAYFAGVLDILRRARRGIGGSGITPGIDWTSIAQTAYDEEQRRRKVRQEEQELLDLMAADLL
jgi:hypothetical protein